MSLNFRTNTLLWSTLKSMHTSWTCTRFHIISSLAYSEFVSNQGNLYLEEQAHCEGPDRFDYDSDSL